MKIYAVIALAIAMPLFSADPPPKPAPKVADIPSAVAIDYWRAATDENAAQIVLERAVNSFTQNSPEYAALLSARSERQKAEKNLSVVCGVGNHPTIDKESRNLKCEVDAPKPDAPKK